MQEIAEVFRVGEEFGGRIALRIGRFLKRKGIKAAGKEGLRHGVGNLGGYGLLCAMRKGKNRGAHFICAKQVFRNVELASGHDFRFAFSRRDCTGREVINIAGCQIMDHKARYIEAAFCAGVAPNCIGCIDDINAARAKSCAGFGCAVNADAGGFIHADSDPCRVCITQANDQPANAAAGVHMRVKHDILAEDGLYKTNALIEHVIPFLGRNIFGNGFRSQLVHVKGFRTVPVQRLVGAGGAACEYSAGHSGCACTASAQRAAVFKHVGNRLRNKGRRAVFIGQRKAIIGLIAAGEEDDVAAANQVSKILGVLHIFIIVDSKRDVDRLHAVFYERIVHGGIVFIGEIHIIVEFCFGADCGLNHSHAGRFNAGFTRALRQSGNVARRIAGGHCED